MQKISIGKMANMLNIEKKQVKQWAHEFNIKTKQAEQHLYSSEELVKFKLIKKLIQKEQYTLEQVKKYFSDNTDHEHNIEITQQLESPIEKFSTPTVLAHNSALAELFDSFQIGQPENTIEPAILPEIAPYDQPTTYLQAINLNVKKSKKHISPAFYNQVQTLKEKLIRLRDLL
jgi:DNA-binding transcriptional MerR regulator